jgi:hypothetical protein
MAATLDEETQAAVDRAQAQQGEPPEPPEPEAPEAEAGEVALEPGTEGAEPSGEAERSEARDPLEDRFARIERENADLRERVQRLSGPPPAEEDDKPPVTAINSFDDLEKYVSWRENKLARRLLASNRDEITHVTAEQAARAQFTEAAMGKGYSYDSIVGKHIAPIERVDPGFSRIISAQPDPGAARYVLGIALEAIGRAGGDVVKGMRDVIAALDGKRTTVKTVLKQVGEASRQQVARTDLRASRSSTQQAGTNAQQMDRDARTMHPADFAKKYPRFIEGY